MIYKIEDIHNISHQEIKVLFRRNISNTHELLNLFSNPEARANFSTESGIPGSKILSWASIADLVRVKGIGIKLAEALVLKADISNVNAFIDRINRGIPTSGYDQLVKGERKEEVKVNITDLLLELNAEATRKRFTQNQIYQAFMEALDLKPRLIINRESKRSFDQKLAQESRRNLRFYRRVIIAVFVPLIAISIALAFYQAFRIKKECLFIDEIIRDYYKVDFNFSSFFAKYMFIESIILILLLGVFTIIFLTLFSLLTTYLSYYLKKNLYRAPELQRSYLSFDFGYLLKYYKKYFRWIIIIIFVLFLTIIIVAIRNFGDFTILDVKWHIIIIGNILVGLIFLPYILIFRRKRIENKSDRMVLERSFTFNTIHVIFIGLVLFAFIKLVIPGTLQSYHFLSEKYTIPRYIKTYDQAIMQLDESNRIKAIEPYYKENLLQMLDDLSEVPRQSAIETFESFSHSKIEPRYINTFFEIIWWMLLPAIVIFLFIPYFILHSPLRGSLLAGIIIVSIMFAKFLEENIPDWFGIQFNRFQSESMIAIILLANVILFDWIAGLIAEKKIICPNCEGLSGKHNRYCPECGFKH